MECAGCSASFMLRAYGGWRRKQTDFPPRASRWCTRVQRNATQCNVCRGACLAGWSIRASLVYPSPSVGLSPIEKRLKLVVLLKIHRGAFRLPMLLFFCTRIKNSAFELIILHLWERTLNQNISPQLMRLRRTNCFSALDGADGAGGGCHAGPRAHRCWNGARRRGQWARPPVRGPRRARRRSQSKPHEARGVWPRMRAAMAPQHRGPPIPSAVAVVCCPASRVSHRLLKLL